MNTIAIENPVKTNTEECCPEFDRTLWERKRFVWKDKLFLKDTVPEFFHIPLPSMYGKAITRMWEKAIDSGAIPDDKKDSLLLAHDLSAWKGELLLAVTHEIPGENHERLSGTFISNVFDGPYSDAPKYIKETDVYLASQKMTAKKYFFYYAYCPKCAKKYGHNYIVVLAQIL